ncbi:hypothetical protein AcV5_001961 [Taiwanofungus camphoratus]|nr:hypothetical protein AcV5_001961 [Antrodia cinnamomea]
MPSPHSASLASPARRSSLTSICVKDVRPPHALPFLSITSLPDASSAAHHAHAHTDTDFVALGAQNSSWNVVRAQFDQLLLQHAAACGVRVFDQTRVTEVRFAPSARNGKPNGARTADGSGGEHGDRDAAPELGRPTAVAYETVRGGTGEIAFDYLVDASGRQGVMSTRYMMNRKFNAALRNVAVWGYWRGTGMYGRGTSRENAPWFEALSDESGWAWFIPLHDGLASVGVVMDQQLLAARTRTGDIPPAPPSLRTPATLPASPLAARYVGLLALAPGLLALLGAGELVGAHGEDGKAPPLARSTSDFSYAADAYAGEGFRVVGDAGGACVSARVCVCLAGAAWRLTAVCDSVHRPVLLVGDPSRHDRRARRRRVHLRVDQGRLLRARRRAVAHRPRRRFVHEVPGRRDERVQADPRAVGQRARGPGREQLRQGVCVLPARHTRRRGRRDPSVRGRNPERARLLRARIRPDEPRATRVGAEEAPVHKREHTQGRRRRHARRVRRGAAAERGHGEERPTGRALGADEPAGRPRARRRPGKAGEAPAQPAGLALALCRRAERGNPPGGSARGPRGEDGARQGERAADHPRGARERREQS